MNQIRTTVLVAAIVLATPITQAGDPDVDAPALPSPTLPPDLPEAISADGEGAQAPPLDALDSELGMLFEDFDIVVTAGRKAQATNLTGVPVSVLHADDIHNSGAPNVPQLLDFVPGVDVLQIDRNRYAIGVRGLHHEFSDRTLVLLDGRNVGSALSGGVDFQRLPIFLEDLGRIEVARGPGGAVWGANAFNGVINLITKDPRDTQGVLLSAQINEYGDAYTQARWGASHGNLAWRLSLGFEDQETSEDAVTHDHFDSRDFARTRRFAGDAVYAVDDSTTLRFGVGHSHVERGDFSFLGLQVGDDERLDYTRLYATLEKSLDPGTKLKLDLFTTLEDVNRPSFWRYGLIDTEFDGQAEFELGDRHTLTAGGTLRLVQIDSNPFRPDMILRDETFDEQWAGAFIADTWRATERWTVEAQARLDWYSGTTLDWSGRLAGLYALDADSHHVLRFAAAKAFRAPQVSLREVETQRLLLPTPPFPAGTYGSELLRAGSLDNEEIYSLEAGYFAKFAENATFRVDGYYQFYQDLTGGRVYPDPFMADRVIAEIDNLGGAQAWGVETELALEGDPGKLSLWYTYNDFRFTYDDDLRNARGFPPPEHAVGARATLNLGGASRFTANYRYTSPTHGDSLDTRGVPETHRLDLTYALDVFDGRGEIAVGVLDVFNETEIAVDAVGSPGAAFETPGRAFWVRLQMKF